MAFRPPECANEQMPRLLDAKNAAAACIARRPGFAVVAGVCRVNFPTTDRIFVAKGGLSSACDLACLGLNQRGCTSRLSMLQAEGTTTGRTVALPKNFSSSSQG
jgi:hypothetical protein